MPSKLEIGDATRSVEVHRIVGGPHSDSFVMVYLPKERLLIEADAYTPAPPNTPPPAVANANNVNLVDNIERLKLGIERILPLHGRVVPLAELYTVDAAADAALRIARRCRSKAEFAGSRLLGATGVKTVGSDAMKSIHWTGSALPCSPVLPWRRRLRRRPTSPPARPGSRRYAPPATAPTASASADNIPNLAGQNACLPRGAAAGAEGRARARTR